MFTKTARNVAFASTLALAAGSQALAAGKGGDNYPTQTKHSHIEVNNAATESMGGISVYGEPNMPYLLWFSTIEEKFDLGYGFVLDINPIRQLTTNLYFGRDFNEYGYDYIEFPVDASWDGSELGLQIITVFTDKNQQPSVGPEIPGYKFDVSNLARATFQKRNTFATAWGKPGVNAYKPYVPDYYEFPGELAFIGGRSSDPVQRYTPWDQENRVENVQFTDLALSAKLYTGIGAVLITGGTVGTPFQGASRKTTIVDLNNNTSSPGPDMYASRAGHCMVDLPDGNILVIGGIGENVSTSNGPISDVDQAYLDSVLQTTEIYDVWNNEFYSGPYLPEPLAFATVTRIGYGRYLIAGGLTVNNGRFEVSNRGYIYDWFEGEFFGPFSIGDRRMLHEAVHLDSGEALIGGVNDAGFLDILQFPSGIEETRFTPMGSTAVLFDDYNELEYYEGVDLSVPRAGAACAEIYDNIVLVVGGTSHTFTLMNLPMVDPNTGVPEDVLSSSEILDFNIWDNQPGPAVKFPRFFATAFESDMDGRILIIGGGPSAIELYQP